MVCTSGLGGGGYSGFQVTGIIEWGHQNPNKSLGLQTNPPKIPGPKFTPPPPQIWAIKISLQNYAAGICGNYHESSDGFEYPQKIPTLGSTYPNNTCQIFRPQNKPKSKISNPKNPLITPVTWNLEYPPWGPGLSKVAGCRNKSPPTWLVSAGYSAWHFFTDDAFLNKNIPWLTTYFNNSAIYFKTFWQPWASALSPTNCIAVFPCHAIK